MDKKALSEADIISKYIMPAVKQSGWDDMLMVVFSNLEVHTKGSQPTQLHLADAMAEKALN